MKQITVRIEDELYKKIEKDAKSQDRSITKQIQNIIKKYYAIKEETRE